MRISDWSSDVCSSDLLERRDATDLGALRDYRVESRNPPQEREAERDRSHPAYLAERWIRESGIHAHLADEGGCQAQATFQDLRLPVDVRSEEHTSELQSLMRISYAVFCLKKKYK